MLGRVPDLRHCQRRTPLLLQDVQAYRAIGINVGVVYLRLEIDLQQGPLNEDGVAVTQC